MKRLTVLAALVLVFALGSYAIFAAHSSHHGGTDSVTGGTTDGAVAGGSVTGGPVGGEPNGAMTNNMTCSGCAVMHASVVASNDGGVIVAAGGRLIKYDAVLKKVLEADISKDIDPNTPNPQKQ